MKRSKYKAIVLASLSFLILAGITTIPGVNSSPHRSAPAYHDYARQGGDYSALQGIELKAHSVEFTGTEKTKLLGTNLEFKNFDITAPIIVQTSCNYVSGTFEPAVGRYKLSVAPDTNDAARREFMRQIKAYWKAKDQEELKDYQYMPQEKWTSPAIFDTWIRDCFRIALVSYIPEQNAFAFDCNKPQCIGTGWL